jgi:hypothetical protein
MKITKNVRAMVSGEGAVIRNLRSGASFSLNPLGAKVWQLLQQGCSAEKIVEQISVDFKAPRETVASDVASFLEQLRKQGLVVSEEKTTVA